MRHGYFASTALFAAAAFAAATALPASGQVQTRSPATANQPLDLRVGAARPSEATEALTDGGSRGQQHATPATSIPLVSLGRDYRAGPNDLIDVEVFEQDNLKRTVRVNAAGAISLPLIGQVLVAGLTSQEMEQRIAARYSEKYLQNPQVTVFIKEFTTERITIEGAVNHPGIFPLTGQITLLRALAIAGGFGPIADMSRVMIYRTNDQNVRESAVFDVEKIRAGKAEDPPIRGDDLIVVQRDSSRVLLRDSLLRDVIDSVNPFSVLVPK